LKIKISNSFFPTGNNNKQKNNRREKEEISIDDLDAEMEAYSLEAKSDPK
jgi:hypothetical protein